MAGIARSAERTDGLPQRAVGDPRGGAPGSGSRSAQRPPDGLVHRHLGEPAVEQMPPPAPAGDEVGSALVRRAERGAKARRVGGREDQVEVVGHQAKAQTATPALRSCSAGMSP